MLETNRSAHECSRIYSTRICLPRVYFPRVYLPIICSALIVSSLFSGCRRADKTSVTSKPTLANESNPAPPSTKTDIGNQMAQGYGYVGSDACSDCHPDISATYRQHSMGRSATELTAETLFPAAEKSRFSADGFTYQMQRQEDGWYQQQARPDAPSSTNVKSPVSHLVGSGKNGQSFIVNHEGFLFMSPMTWYPGKDLWDLSPGYEVRNSQFNRPVIEECLYCHTDGANAVHGTLNRYEKDRVVRAHAIGCERCHGPGESHVAAMESNPQNAPSIVNPGKLGFKQREAVCQQCHLSGATRVLKPHRQLNDFRPGQDLESTYTIFTLVGDGKDFVGHVEQMYQSRCFLGSDGELGCTSCHDPHALPSAAERVEFYREKCLACHGSDQQTECGVSASERTKTSPPDDCVLCHMPRRPTEIRHAAVTDHTVPRSPNTIDRVTESSGITELQAFPEASAATPRDHAIGLVNLATRYPKLMGSAVRTAVRKQLEDATQRDPQDWDAIDALVEIYLGDGNVDEALQLCQRVLDSHPERESTLQFVAEIHSQLGQHQQAAGYWEKILGVNPWIAKYWFRLAQSYAALQRWSRCQQLVLEGKKRFPTSMGLRQLLVESYLQQGDTSAAEQEYQEMKSFNPDRFDSVRAWYENHPRRQ